MLFSGLSHDAGCTFSLARLANLSNATDVLMLLRSHAGVELGRYRKRTFLVGTPLCATRCGVGVGVGQGKFIAV